MYHITNQQMYHHNAYEQCPILFNNSKHHTASSAQNNQLETVFIQNTADKVQPDSFHKQEECQDDIPKSKQVTKIITNKANVDTSSFTVEERLVAAVWVHERKRTKSSMAQIKHDFRQRFGREPPAKNTFIVWERKLFSTGSVCDASRPGRPVNRRSRVDEVAASIRSAPGLSLRARALALRLPRTTLKAILCKDLSHTLNMTKDLGQKSTGKQQVRRSNKQKVIKCQPAVPHQPAPPTLAGCSLPHHYIHPAHTHTTYI